MRSLFIILLALCAFTPAWCAETATDGSESAADVTPFPLKFCVTCGDDVASEESKSHTVTKIHKGREIKMCRGCVKIFNADPDGYLKQVDQAIKDGKPVREGH